MINKAKLQAMKYIVTKLRTEKEISQYLIKKNYSEEVIEMVIDELKKERLINDQGYACAWIRDRNNLKPLGKKKMYYELKEKGIAEQYIQWAIEEEFPTEVERELAKELATKKWRVSENIRKVENFLLYRGFSYDIVNYATKDLPVDGNNDRGNLDI